MNISNAKPGQPFQVAGVDPQISPDRMGRFSHGLNWTRYAVWKNDPDIDGIIAWLVAQGWELQIVASVENSYYQNWPLMSWRAGSGCAIVIQHCGVLPVHESGVRIVQK